MFMLAMAALAAAQTHYVDADVLNVRETPGGDIVARLVSNDTVDVLERRGAYAHVRHQWGEGWVSNSFLAENRVDNLRILRSQAAPIADRLRAAERMMVAYGYSPGDRSMIEAELRLMGENDRANTIGRPPPIHAAVCDGQDLIVAGVIGQDGQFSSWTDGNDLQGRLTVAATQHWYNTRGTHSERYPAARLDAQAMIFRGEGVEEVIALGSCREVGAIYLSRWDTSQAARPVPAAELYSRAQTALASLGDVSSLRLQQVFDVVHVQATNVAVCDDDVIEDDLSTCGPTYVQQFILDDGTVVTPQLSDNIEHAIWVDTGVNGHHRVVLGTDGLSLMVFYPTQSPVVEHRVDFSYGGC